VDTRSHRWHFLYSQMIGCVEDDMIIIRRRTSHQEHFAAMEMERFLPGQSPVLSLHQRAGDPRRAVATIPELERNTLYLGRVVTIADGPNERRLGFVESIYSRFALVRYAGGHDESQALAPTPAQNPDLHEFDISSRHTKQNSEPSGERCGSKRLADAASRLMGVVTRCPSRLAVDAATEP
jgi:hypothetical protein